MIISAKAEKNGFDTVFCNETFKCAFITASRDYSFGAVNVMKKHNNTDEIFVLLCGRAVMLTIENDEFKETVLKTERAYNVAKGTWHYLAVSEDAKVFVAENADTNADTSEELILSSEYVIK